LVRIVLGHEGVVQKNCIESLQCTDRRWNKNEVSLSSPDTHTADFMTKGRDKSEDEELNASIHSVVAPVGITISFLNYTLVELDKFYTYYLVHFSHQLSFHPIGTILVLQVNRN